MKLNKYLERLSVGISSSDLEEMSVTLTAFSKSIEGTTLTHPALVFLGRSGAGKSTLVNFLSGINYERTRVGRRRMLRPNRPEAVHVGHSAISATLTPQCVGLGDLTLWDMPGFEDTRGTQEDLITASTPMHILNSLHQIQGMVVVIDGPTWHGRMVGVRDVLSHVGTLGEDLPWTLAVTRLNPDDEHEDIMAHLSSLFSDETGGADPLTADIRSLLTGTDPTLLKRQSFLKMVQYFLKNPDRICLINPCDPSSRDAILTTMTTAPRAGIAGSVLNLSQYAKHLPVLRKLTRVKEKYDDEKSSEIKKFESKLKEALAQHQSLEKQHQRTLESYENIKASSVSITKEIDTLKERIAGFDKTFEQLETRIQEAFRGKTINEGELEKIQEEIQALASDHRQIVVHTHTFRIPKQVEHPQARAYIKALREGRDHPEVPLYQPIEVPVRLYLDFPISKFELEEDPLLRGHMAFEGRLSDDHKVLEGVYRTHSTSCASRWYRGETRPLKIKLFTYAYETPLNKGLINGLRIQLKTLESQLGKKKEDHEQFLAERSELRQSKEEHQANLQAKTRQLTDLIQPREAQAKAQLESLNVKLRQSTKSLNTIQNAFREWEKESRSDDDAYEVLGILVNLNPEKKSDLGPKIGPVPSPGF